MKICTSTQRWTHLFSMQETLQKACGRQDLTRLIYLCMIWKNDNTDSPNYLEQAAIIRDMASSNGLEYCRHALLAIIGRTKKELPV